VNKKFVVRLSGEERQQLEALLAKGKAAARKLTRARILLKADCGPLGPAWTDLHISEALDVGSITIHRVRRSFVEGGLDGALVRRPLPRRRPARWRPGGPPDRSGLWESAGGPVLLDASAAGDSTGRTGPCRERLA